MEFPTIQQFEKSKGEFIPILRWRDLPKNIIYHVKSVVEMPQNTSRFDVDTSIYAKLQDNMGEFYRVWLPKRLRYELKDHGWDSKEVFLMSKGLKMLDGGRQFFDFDIMRR